MRSEDIRAFAARRWDLVEAAKAEFWAREKARQSPAQALRLADALRRHVLAIHADWPTVRERDDDLRSHAAVAKKLSLVRTRSDR